MKCIIYIQFSLLNFIQTFLGIFVSQSFFLGFKKITHFKIYDEHAYILIYRFICL